MSPTNCGCILSDFMEVVFLCVVVTKGAQFDQFDWPRTFRSQVSMYNKDINFVIDSYVKKEM